MERQWLHLILYKWRLSKPSFSEREKWDSQMLFIPINFQPLHSLIKASGT